MTDENDADHVVDFAFEPFRPGRAGDAVHLQTGVTTFQDFLVARSCLRRGRQRRIEKHFQPQSIVVGNAGQAVVDPESMLGPGIIKVIDAVDSASMSYRRLGRPEGRCRLGRCPVAGRQLSPYRVVRRRGI